jgi:hypothetical protein
VSRRWNGRNRSDGDVRDGHRSVERHRLRCGREDGVREDDRVEGEQPVGAEAAALLGGHPEHPLHAGRGRVSLLRLTAPRLRLGRAVRAIGVGIRVGVRGHDATCWGGGDAHRSHPVEHSEHPSAGWQHGGSGVATGSASQQHACFFVGLGACWRDATSGRTCSGGSTPLASAHRSFSSRVKQQQSPAQHSSEVRHPHGRLWHGYGVSPSGFGRRVGTGTPTAPSSWLTSVSANSTR